MAALILGPGGASTAWGGLCTNGQQEARQHSLSRSQAQSQDILVSYWAPRLELLGTWPLCSLFTCTPAFGGLRYQQALWDDSLAWITSILQRICVPPPSRRALHTRLSPAQRIQCPTTASHSQVPCPMPACYPSRPCALASPGASGMAICSCMLVGWRKGSRTRFPAAIVSCQHQNQDSNLSK